MCLFTSSFTIFIGIVADLSGPAYFEWKAHRGKVYDVQFGSADEKKVYSLGEDTKFYLWDTSATSAPLREIHFQDYQHPPQLRLEVHHTWSKNKHICHPAIGRSKLFGFGFAHKYILISSVEGNIFYQVR